MTNRRYISTWRIRMDNQVAAKCCGSCEHYEPVGEFCEPQNTDVFATDFYCGGNDYSPRNPIPIISIPGVKELVEAVNNLLKETKVAADMGRECIGNTNANVLIYKAEQVEKLLKKTDE